MALLNSLTADFEEQTLGLTADAFGTNTGWQRTNADRTLIVPSNHPVAGGKCSWVERRVGDVNAGGNRTELSDQRATRVVPANNADEAFYGYSFYLPASTGDSLGGGYGINDAVWEAAGDFAQVFQVHMDAGSPPIGLYVDRSYDAGRTFHDVYITYRGPTAATQDWIYFTNNDQEVRGVWVDVAMRARFALDGTGLLSARIRFNGGAWSTAVTANNIVLGHNSGVDAYTKFGPYVGTDARFTMYTRGYCRRQSFAEVDSWLDGDTPVPNPNAFYWPRR